MRKYSFEKNGINYDIIVADINDLADYVESTHHCIKCGTAFNTEQELAHCPNGCEGLIRGKMKNE